MRSLPEQHFSNLQKISTLDKSTLENFLLFVVFWILIFQARKEKLWPHSKHTRLRSLPEISPGNTWIQSLVTNFLSLNPRQYQSNHHMQDFLITTSNICHCLKWYWIGEQTKWPITNKTWCLIRTLKVNQWRFENPPICLDPLKISHS